MIFFLMNFLRNFLDLKIPLVFEYTSTRMALAAITTLGLTIFLGPWFVRKLYELKIGQTIRTDECPLLGELHEKKQDTPTMGGILMLSSMLISMFLWMDLTHSFTLLLFVTTVCLGSLGGYDDYLKLKYKSTDGLAGRKKLLFQFLLVAGISLYLLCPAITSSIHFGDWYAPPAAKEFIYQADGVGDGGSSSQQRSLSTIEYISRLYVPFFKGSVYSFTGFGISLLFVLFFFVITGTSNAVNLTDGLDGLASGCLIMVASSFAMIAFVSNNIVFARYLHILYIEGSGEIAIYLCGLVGACLGFLWYNGHPAQVFMGDTGSLTLGGIIGVAALLLKRELLLSIVGGVFVAEAMSVILQVASYKLRNKKRIFLCAPLHHHFEYKGWPETKVVIRFWIIGLLLAIVGVASLKFQ
ncbi:MAG: phospho-N-acetylmuramoyl-pentapeptide-transferase [Chlamydiales bacterium]|jgi:phospho-N-acetylmuramoyl-pentapeptide-transferase